MCKWEHSVHREAYQTSKTRACQDKEQLNTRRKNIIGNGITGAEREILCQFVLYGCGDRKDSGDSRKNRY